jgi:hypothetical protein
VQTHGWLLSHSPRLPLHGLYGRASVPAQHPAELVGAGLGATSGDDREDHMAGGITGQSQFWEATIGDILDLLGVALLRLDEVAAGVTGLEARGIDSCDRDAAS